MNKGKNGSNTGAHGKGKRGGKYDVHVTVNASAEQILKATLRPLKKKKKGNG